MHTVLLVVFLISGYWEVQIFKLNSIVATCTNTSRVTEEICAILKYVLAILAFIDKANTFQMLVRTCRREFSPCFREYGQMFIMETNTSMQFPSFINI